MWRSFERWMSQIFQSLPSAARPWPWRRRGCCVAAVIPGNGAAYNAQAVPGYTGAAEYVDEPAVRDRGLITASWLADVEFAAELFNELGVLRESERALWTRMFRGGRFPPESTQ